MTELPISEQIAKLLGLYQPSYKGLNLGQIAKELAGGSVTEMASGHAVLEVPDDHCLSILIGDIIWVTAAGHLSMGAARGKGVRIGVATGTGRIRLNDDGRELVGAVMAYDRASGRAHPHSPRMKP